MNQTQHYVEPYGIGGFLKGLAKGIGGLGAGLLGNMIVPGLGFGLGSGLFTGLTEGSLKKGILSGLTAYAGSKALTDAGKAAQLAHETARKEAVQKAAESGIKQVAARGAGEFLPNTISMPGQIAALGSGAQSAAEPGLMAGIRALGSSAGREGLVDSLSSASNLSFVYPQMAQLSASISEEDESERGSGQKDTYEEELARAMARFRRKHGENPWGNMYGYRSGAIVRPSMDGYATGGFQPGEKPYEDSDGYHYGDEEDREAIPRQGGGSKKDKPPPLFRYARPIAEGFIPGLMPEYNYFSSAPNQPPMDISGFDIGSDPFAEQQVADAINDAGLSSYLAEMFGAERPSSGLAENLGNHEVLNTIPQTLDGKAAGGPVEGGEELQQKAVQALLGQLPHEEASAVIEEFRNVFGPEALEALMQMVMAERSKQKGTPPKNQGLIQGPGGGMGDQIIADVAGADPVALSSGEFVVPADVVSMLGDGDTSTGAAKLESMMKDVRREKTGTTKQAPPMQGIMSLR